MDKQLPILSGWIDINVTLCKCVSILYRKTFLQKGTHVRWTDYTFFFLNFLLWDIVFGLFLHTANVILLY